MNLAEDAAAELLAVGKHIAGRNGIDLTDIEAHELAVAAAVDLDGDCEGVTLLVGADDDFDAVENDPDLQHLIERFRTESV